MRDFENCMILKKFVILKKSRDFENNVILTTGSEQRDHVNRVQRPWVQRSREQHARVDHVNSAWDSREQSREQGTKVT